MSFSDPGFLIPYSTQNVPSGCIISHPAHTPEALCRSKLTRLTDHLSSPVGQSRPQRALDAPWRVISHSYSPGRA